MGSIELIKRVAGLVSGSNYTVLLTGAGLSSEAGLDLPTPSNRRLWSEKGRYHTLEGFKADPVGAWRYYSWVIGRILALKDNDLYKWIAGLYRAKLITSIVTTNIDCLHKLSGVDDVIELHGCILRARCVDCGFTVWLGGGIDDVPPRCRCGGLLRPAVVFYGEKVFERQWIRAVIEAGTADLMIVIGFSGRTAPANMLPLLTRRNNGKVIVVDPSPSPIRDVADIWVPVTAGFFIRYLKKYLGV